MAERKVILTHVYIPRGVVSAWVAVDGARRSHHVGHLPWQGWFCTCSKGKRCAQIQHVKALVPVEAVEAGARSVEIGTAPGGACTPITGSSLIPK